MDCLLTSLIYKAIGGIFGHKNAKFNLNRL
jgi:hypothetical protein